MTRYHCLLYSVTHHSIFYMLALLPVIILVDVSWWLMAGICYSTFLITFPPFWLWWFWHSRWRVLHWCIIDWPSLMPVRLLIPAVFLPLLLFGDLLQWPLTVIVIYWLFLTIYCCLSVLCHIVWLLLYLLFLKSVSILFIIILWHWLIYHWWYVVFLTLFGSNLMSILLRYSATDDLPDDW